MLGFQPLPVVTPEPSDAQHGQAQRARRGPEDHDQQRLACRCPTSRSFPSSRATARARTSGAPRCACSTPPSPRPTAASARSTGWRSTPARSRTSCSTPGCRTRRSQACREYLVSIKGPLTTPIGGGIRSLNVALRQMLDLYVCLRPVRWFKGVPSPVKAPGKVDMVIFRENTEDIYAGIEFEAGSAENEKFKELFKEAFPKLYGKIRFPDTSGIGIKAVSREGTERLMRSAIQYAIDNKRKSVTIVHKGNIMKFTEGAFRNWGYALAEREFAEHDLHLGPVGAHQGREGREGRERRAGRGEGGRQGHHQGRDRRHHAAAGADAPRGVRRHRHDEPERRLPLRRAGRAGRRHRHRAGRQHQLHDRATPCSRPRTAPRRSTPISTRSTRAR